MCISVHFVRIKKQYAINKGNEFAQDCKKRYYFIYNLQTKQEIFACETHQAGNAAIERRFVEFRLIFFCFVFSLFSCVSKYSFYTNHKVTNVSFKVLRVFSSSIVMSWIECFRVQQNANRRQKKTRIKNKSKMWSLFTFSIHKYLFSINFMVL